MKNASQFRPPAVHEIDHQAFKVTGLPAFNDNYIWIVAASTQNKPGQAVAVVDPGDAAPVIDYCRRQGVLPEQIWLTHHHADHTGGVAELCDWVLRQSSGAPPAVSGPAAEEIPGVTQPLRGGESLMLDGVGVQVLPVPGHTRGHLAYFVPPTDAISPAALFCGDAMFGLGCGRLFEGTAAQMYESLGRIRALPAETRIYCAHEYTLLNLPFALAVDPDNAALRSRAETIRRLRQNGEPTVPLSLAEECATNPFLRSDQDALRVSAMTADEASPVEVFTRLRQMRDSFKPPH